MIGNIKNLRPCVIIPTYNNEGTIANMIKSVWTFCKDIIVINDGCTDGTNDILRSFQYPITVVSFHQNRGKGHALVIGLKKAMAMGYSHAITIDADGQHFASDIPSFISEMERCPNALIMGNRNLNEKNMPRGNKFANNFSNFWFLLQTGIHLADTQSGFRLYPLTQLHGLNLITSRYEAELELLVMAAWRGTKIVSIPIKVYYPPIEERVSHFRPTYDFVRISILNVILCIGAIIYGWPMYIIRCIKKK